jgi:hypothetical protein
MPGAAIVGFLTLGNLPSGGKQTRARLARRCELGGCRKPMAQPATERYVRRIGCHDVHSALAKETMEMAGSDASCLQQA